MNKYLEKIAARRQVKNMLETMIDKGRLHPRQDVATVKGMLKPRTGSRAENSISPETFFKNRADIRARTADQIHNAATDKQRTKVIENFKDQTRSRTGARSKLNEGEGGFGEGSHVWPAYLTNKNIADGNHVARTLRNMDKKYK